LQTELNNKALSSTVTSLQTTVSGKQDKLSNLIDATVKKLTATNITLNGTDLKTTLDSKISTIANNSITFDMVDGLNSTLDYKQARLTGDSLIRIGGLAVGSGTTIPENGYLSVKNGILVGGVDIMDVIDGNLLVDQNKYCFRAAITSNSVVVYNSSSSNFEDKIIHFDKVIFCLPDPAAYTVGNYSYTIPIRGIWDLSVYCFISTPRTGTNLLTISIHDETRKTIATNDGYSYRSNSVSAMILLEAGTRIYAVVTSLFGSTTSIFGDDATTYFSGSLYMPVQASGII